ncbi:unnamed protein product [Durusdinium trenchii]|uniref:ADP-ribosylglycohydrolase n=1 Tax=Durusdinium trenchii TaxID=1381693 RepID=A0ABP0NWP3_9DINO
MGTTPSVQEDLQNLKKFPAKNSSRRQAFQRLQQSLVSRLGTAELLSVVAQVERLRFELWQAPPSGATRLPPQVLADRVRGTVFGAALGDAAGLATEFLSHAEAVDFYGPKADFQPGREVFPDEHRMMWCAGDWTDDTDQQVLLMQSLLNTKGHADPCDFAARLASWRTSGFPELGDQSAAGLGQTTKLVLNDPDFTSAPHKAAAAHSSKTPSNGGVMRTAVAGIPHFWDEDTVCAAADSFCRTTHADPRCVASCLVVALCVSRLLRGEDTEDIMESVARPAMAKARAECALSEEWDEEMQRHAEGELSDLNLDERKTIGYTFKCLGAGLWALRSSGSFESVLNQLILAAGDADTNGTDWIAGMPYSSWLEAYVQKVLFMLRLREAS